MSSKPLTENKARSPKQRAHADSQRGFAIPSNQVQAHDSWWLRPEAQTRAGFDALAEAQRERMRADGKFTRMDKLT